MILQLQPQQVPEYWDEIKYGAVAAMELDPPAHEYTQALFSAILSGTHQCWLIVDENRDLTAMGITCILQDTLTGFSQLHVDAFYSYKTISDELALDATEYMKSFAIANGCGQIHALTNQPRAARLLELVGFRANKTEYILSCG